MKFTTLNFSEQEKTDRIESRTKNANLNSHPFETELIKKLSFSQHSVCELSSPNTIQ